MNLQERYWQEVSSLETLAGAPYVEYNPSHFKSPQGWMDFWKEQFALWRDNEEMLRYIIPKLRESIGGVGDQDER